VQPGLGYAPSIGIPTSLTMDLESIPGIHLLFIEAVELFTECSDPDTIGAPIRCALLSETGRLSSERL
jgi:hypothetical protein